METRIGPRVSVNLKIISRIGEDSEQKLVLAEGNRFEADAYDISIGGMGISTKYFFPKGLIIALEIDGSIFGLSETMKFKGEVCYSNYIKRHTYKCGIKFLDIADKYKNAISQFISTYEKRKKEGER